MAIPLDHAQAKNILFEEAAAAKASQLSGLALTWRTRVAKLGELCPPRRSATVIAALGTALLAKAVNPRVDVYSILDRGDDPNSYSARSLADGVLACHRAELNIDLGANGPNPLNNTPFIGKTRIDHISGVRNAEGWESFLDCLRAAAALRSSADARQALRGFIAARTGSLLQPIEIDPSAGDGLTVSKLVDAIDGFVAEASEGGRRAQACVAALLDSAFGPDRIVSAGINDPDRRAPLDVAVLDAAGGFLHAFEVKDKPMSDHQVRSSVEKTVKAHAVCSVGFVAIGKKQGIREFDEVTRWAATHGVKVTIFLSWLAFFEACKCFAPATARVFEGMVFRRILARTSELRVSREGVERFRSICSGSM